MRDVDNKGEVKPKPKFRESHECQYPVMEYLIMDKHRVIDVAWI